MELAKQLVDQFVERGYKWRIDDQLRPPSYEDMKEVLDKAYADLEDGQIMEMGRLIMIKTGTHLDVYLYQGDYS